VCVCVCAAHDDERTKAVTEIYERIHAHGLEKQEQRDENALMSLVSSSHIAETFPPNVPFLRPAGVLDCECVCENECNQHCTANDKHEKMRSTCLTNSTFS
jgi:hypothetical protein